MLERLGLVEGRAIRVRRLGGNRAGEIRPETGGGGYLHGVIALDAADGALLGLVDAGLLERS